MTAQIQNSLQSVQQNLSQFITEKNIQTISAMSNVIADCLQQGGKILTCGNGGSMCEAMHFAQELTGKFRQERKPYAAIALSDPSHLTCTGNDFGFGEIFARLIEAIGNKGDVLVIFSTSGHSENVIRATFSAIDRQMKVIGLLGRTGGIVKDYCWEGCLICPGETSDRIQELHQIVMHILVEAIEVRFGGVES